MNWWEALLVSAGGLLAAFLLMYAALKLAVRWGWVDENDDQSG